MSEHLYVISVKSAARGQHAPNWSELLGAVRGLRFVSSPRGFRVLVELEQRAVAEVRRLVGEFCHVERNIEHTVDDRVA